MEINVLTVIAQMAVIPDKKVDIIYLKQMLKLYSKKN